MTFQHSGIRLSFQPFGNQGIIPPLVNTVGLGGGEIQLRRGRCLQLILLLGIHLSLGAVLLFTGMLFRFCLMTDSLAFVELEHQAGLVHFRLLLQLHLLALYLILVTVVYLS